MSEKLTTEDKNKINTWVSEGLSLSDIQKKIKEELNLSMTYQDVRFLIDDLNIQLPEEKEEEHPTASDAIASSDTKPADAELVSGSVSVEVDKVTRPGTVVSGTVTFSDGVSATWQLDQMGRIGLSPSKEDYKPSPEDLQEFQKELQQELQKSGF